MPVERLPKRPKIQQSADKGQGFLDSNEIIFIRSIEHDKPIDKQYYCAPLDRLEVENKVTTNCYAEDSPPISNVSYQYKWSLYFLLSLYLLKIIVCFLDNKYLLILMTICIPVNLLNQLCENMPLELYPSDSPYLSFLNFFPKEVFSVFLKIVSVRTLL